MEEEAVRSFLSDCNCSQCILRAAERHYGLNISDDAIDMCVALNAGFGVGGFCNALVAGVMLFGHIADECAAKRMRMRLLTEFYDKYHDFNCAKLVNEENGECGCRELIEYVAGKIKEIIDSEVYQ